MNILWIDDEKNRKDKCDYINELENHNSEFLLIDNNTKIDDVITKSLKEKYDIIIIDECFTKSSTYMKHGSYLPNIFLTNKSKAFFIGITADANHDIINNEYLKLPYHVFIEDESFFRQLDHLLSIGNDYKTLTKQINSITKLIPQIFKKNNFPKTKELISAIPKQVLNDFQSAHSKKALFQWIYNVFLQRAGFLYNEIWLSTLLGIKCNSLSKIEPYFNSARYEGLFAHDKKLWWVDDIKELLVCNTTMFSKDVSSIDSFWERGRLINGINKNDYSKCQISHVDHPEFVAYKDSSLQKLVQIKYKYTEPIDTIENIDHFEEIRVYNDDLL